MGAALAVGFKHSASVGGDARPSRGFLGGGGGAAAAAAAGEFRRFGVRPGPGTTERQHRRLDETSGGPFPLLRHEGFGSRYGTALLIFIIDVKSENIDDCRFLKGFFFFVIQTIITDQRLIIKLDYHIKRVY